MRTHLSKSAEWKQAQIGRAGKEGCTLIHYGEKEYLGCYLPDAMIELKRLPKIEADLRKTLNEYCPKLRQDKLALHIFSQSFIH